MLLQCPHLHPFTTYFQRIPSLHRHQLHPTAAATDPGTLRCQNNSPDPSLERSVQLPAQDRLRLFQLSTSHKRSPQFPGSVSSFDTLTEVPGTPEGRIDDDSEEMIMRALSVRRKATVEIFKEAMKQGKFGITYTKSLTDKVPEFIDYVMIEAATMKRLPMFMTTSFNVRAEAVIRDSNVVPLIRWLKHNGLSYPQIGKLICMSKGNLESVRRVVHWLKSIHVNGRFLGVVLGRAGERMLQRSSQELDEIVEFLESCGVRRDWMGNVMSRSPQLLSYTMEEIKVRVDFYLDMGMNMHDFGTMVFDYPKVLGFFSMEEMNQKVKYLKEFGLNTESVGKLLAFKPQLMACSIEDRWKPLVRYLYYLGITREGMKRMLVIKPMVFCVNLEEIIVPKVRFFQDIGIRNETIGKMLVKFPPLLTYSLHKKIRPVVVFLMTKAGVSKTDIAKVIALGPELLGCSIYHKLEPNFKYFLSLGIRLHQLGQMIADFPMLLRYNVELLRPKYRYLRRTMVRPLKDLIEFPRFMSYSLEGRIIPRHKVLIENRVNFKLRYMLATTDEEFEKRVRAAVERRLRFESGNSNGESLSIQTNGENEGNDFSGWEEDEMFSSASDDSDLESDGQSEVDEFCGEI